ncbi:hypothetical protein GCM10023115_24070 [Pontixanthobacter gangjinensis]
MPDYLDGNDNWEDIQLLIAYRDQFARDARSLEWADDFSTVATVFEGGAITAVAGGAAIGALAGGTASGLAWFASVKLETNRAQVRALNARLKYLVSCPSSR